MRRQGARYGGGDSSGGGHNAYSGGATAQMQQNSKSGYYQGRHQEQQEGGGEQDNQWRWERDGGQDKLPQTAMSPTAPFSEGMSFYNFSFLQLVW